MNRWFGALATATLAATIGSAAHAASFSQTIIFDTISPFGVFSQGQFVAGGWSQPLPFTQESQIHEIRVHFASEDPDWLDGVGPLGGEPRVEVGFLDDVPSRFAVASVDLAHPNIILGPAQDPVFSKVRSLVFDGDITASLGGFENFPGYTDAFTFQGQSSLTLEIEGDVPSAPVPEPASVLLFGVGLGGAALAARRRTRRSA